jgi:alkaline phosphatase
VNVHSKPRERSIADNFDRHPNARYLKVTRIGKMNFNCVFFFILAFLSGGLTVEAQTTSDYLRQMQFEAVESKAADWVHWGDRESVFSNWTNHSNRLIPIYTFGMKLDSVKGENSVYRDRQRLEQLYGKLPEETLNPKAEYFDQTDVYRLQKEAIASGKKNVVVIVFDGLDWQTTQAAAIYRSKKVNYLEGRGTGLSFQDYRGAETDFGYFVCSPHNNDTRVDVNAQVVTQIGGQERVGGYDANFGGDHPWSIPGDCGYLLCKRKSRPHPYTDSAASATSMMAGIKTYNASINTAPDGSKVAPIAHELQANGFSIGVVSSVPISHATPACAYAQNVTRNDYQDLTRDLLGLPSKSNRQPLPGVDVLIGAGWGDEKADDRKKQGQNFVPGNKYLTKDMLRSIDLDNDGKYVVAQRTPNRSGKSVLNAAVKKAVENDARLFGFFGVETGHLPYQTADGDYRPTRGIRKAEVYSKDDLMENPTLADMTEAALEVLQHNPRGFWLLVEAGDVDWANHNNNIDDSIGAVFSGEEAFDVVRKWVETNSTWDETVVILTADHGHMLVVENLEALTGGAGESRNKVSSSVEYQREIGDINN